MIELQLWKQRNNISDAAFVDLLTLFNINTLPEYSISPEKAEARVQQDIRFEAPSRGVITWRNNVGAYKDDRGVQVRYGLCNDSKRLNQKVKSSDLIGIKKVLIKPEHVGMILGQFWAREVKAEGWEYTGRGREPAQFEFHKIVARHGGDAGFATSINDI